MSMMSTTLRSLVNRSLAPFGPRAGGERFDSPEDLLESAERQTGLGAGVIRSSETDWKRCWGRSKNSRG